MTSEKRTLLKNTLFNGASQSAAMIAAFIFMPMLVRSFGLANYGLYVLISAITSYASLLDLGIGTALTKTVAEARATEDPALGRQAISTALVFYAAIGAIVALGLAVLASFSATIFHVTGAQADLLRNLLLVSAAFELLLWPASTARYVLAGLQRYDVVASSAMLGTTLSIVSTVLVLVFRKGPLLLVTLGGVALLVSSGVLVVMAVRLAGFGRVSFAAASRSRFSIMLAFSWAAFVVQLSDVLFYQQTDRIILGMLAGAIAVGLYEASAKINQGLIYASGLTVSAVVPLASSMDASGRESSLRSLFMRGSKYGAALIAPVTIALAVLAKPLLNRWLGPAYAEQSIVLQTLILPHVLVSVGVMGDAILISRGRMGRRVPFIVGQALLNVALSVLLVPRIGVLGVAVGTAVAHIVDFPFHIDFLLKQTRVTFGEWLREVVVPVYPLLLVPVAAGLLALRTPLTGSLVGLAVAGVAICVAYWCAFVAWGLPADERRDVLAVVGSLFGRQAG